MDSFSLFTVMYYYFSSTNCEVMDFSKASEKILDIVAKVNEYYDKIIEIRDKYVSKINKLIEDLENAINNAITSINNGVASAEKWLKAKIKTITDKIEKILESLKSKLEEILKGLKEWYNETITNIKVNVVISVTAMLNAKVSKEQAQLLADAIPHPDIESLIPEVKIEPEIPDLNSINFGEIDKIYIPRIEI